MQTIYKEFKVIADKFKNKNAVTWKEGGEWKNKTYKEFKTQINNLSDNFFCKTISIAALASKTAIIAPYPHGSNQLHLAV